MKIRNTLFAAAFAVFAALTASAQTQPGARPATPAPAQQRPAAPTGGAVTVADGKFAVIDTEAFGDQKNGIKRLVAAFQAVEREFKPRRDEIQTLKTRYDALVKQASDTRTVADPKSLAGISDQAETLKEDIERKQSAGQRDLNKRVKELTDPIYADIGTALQAFARARGLSVVFDISKMGGVVMVVNQGVDITPAFIAEYNQRNPATASAAPAAGRP